MGFKLLFDQGIEFSTYLEQGEEDEKQAVARAKAKLNRQLDEKLESAISDISYDVHILIAGEIWCPDCQLNITAVQAMSDIQPRIKMAIVSRDFAREYLLEKLALEEIKIPLMVILDQYYQPKGVFIEQPLSVKESQNDDTMQAYENGDCLNQTVAEVLAIIEQ